jgi:CHASE3 domain sensor protein
MSKLGLRAKLAIGFSVLLAMLVILGGMAYMAIRKVTAATEEANLSLKKKELATLLEVGVRKQIQSANDNVFNGDAGSLERYGKSAHEMSRNVSEAAIAAGEISQTIGGVSRAAELASASAAESQRAVEELADMSRQLNCLVTQFKIDIHEVATSGAEGRPQSLAAAASK